MKNNYSKSNNYKFSASRDGNGYTDVAFQQQQYRGKLVSGAIQRREVECNGRPGWESAILFVRTAACK